MATGDFIVLFIFLLISCALLVSLIYLEDFISPKVKPAGMGNAAVESAERPFAGSRLVGFQYYLYAILFVIIEALLVFLFLWGQNIQELGIAVFVAVCVGLIYMLLLVRYFIDRAKDVL